MSRRRRSGSGPRTAQRFWSGATRPEPAEPIALVDDPTAMVVSLGQPPLGVHSGSALHYLEAMYQKASSVAVALAASADLLQTDADDDGSRGAGEGSGAGTRAASERTTDHDDDLEDEAASA
jgi:hypothetical protein